jgi:hypothetical protein
MRDAEAAKAVAIPGNVGTLSDADTMSEDEAAAEDVHGGDVEDAPTPAYPH